MLERYQQIERSIIKTYRKKIWNNFVGAIKEYELISAGDKIAVCISGGKDSMLLAKCMQQLQRHSEVPFSLEFLVMDPGYNRENRELLLQNAELMNIPVKVFDSDIFETVTRAGGTPCYLCARMRRGFLYSKARELGCNKIALGHHFDDAVETMLLNMLYASEIKTMMPKLRSQNFEGMELIRPLYKVKERDIIAWSRFNELKFLRCACRFTEKSEEVEDLSKRREVKRLIETIRQSHPEADDSLFRSMHNVNRGAMLGYRERDGEEAHSFLEDY